MSLVEMCLYQKVFWYLKNQAYIFDAGSWEESTHSSKLMHLNLRSTEYKNLLSIVTIRCFDSLI